MNFFLKIFRALRKRKEPPGNNRVSGGLTLKNDPVLNKECTH